MLKDRLLLINHQQAATSVLGVSTAVTTQLTTDGTYIWGCDYTNNLLIKTDATTLLEVARYTVPVAHPSGVAFDGTHIWISCLRDFTAPNVWCRFSPVTSQFTQFSSTNGPAILIRTAYYFNGFLYFCTSEGFLKVNLSGAVVGNVTSPTPKGCTDLTFDGTYIYTCNQGTWTRYTEALVNSGGWSLGGINMGGTVTSNGVWNVETDGVNVYFARDEGLEVHTVEGSPVYFINIPGARSITLCPGHTAIIYTSTTACRINTATGQIIETIASLSGTNQTTVLNGVAYSIANGRIFKAPV